jgi:hypothetical protein
MIGGIGPEEYDELCHRLGAVLKDATPAEAVIAVVSKGDPRLVEIEGREGRHFPGDPQGRYAGYYPRTSEEAISQLEQARRAGTEFFCLPATALWWLDHYQALAAWLGSHSRVVAEDPETCVLYDLVRVPREATEEQGFGAEAQVQALLDSLLPADAVVYAIGLAGEELTAPGRTVNSIEAAGVFALRRRLESASDRPTFLLFARDEATAPADRELERSLAAWTRPIARRENLCSIFQVTAGRGRSRPMRSPREGESLPSPSRAFDGEAADKLSNRLERLGLPGDDGPLAESHSEGRR